MSDTTIDYLAMPAGKLDEPSFPVICEGVKRMIIRDYKEDVFQGKDGSEGKVLKVKLETTEPDKDSEGNGLHAGWAFNDSTFLTPNENNSPKQIGERVGMIIKAALGAKTETSHAQCLANPTLITGKLVSVKIGIRKGKGEREGEFNNTVKNWIVSTPAN
jgi:hypothetical protein